jgi:hypothetical protein
MGWRGQYDAAVDPTIAKTKMKGVDNPVAGKVVLRVGQSALNEKLS